MRYPLTPLHKGGKELIKILYESIEAKELIKAPLLRGFGGSEKYWCTVLDQKSL